MSMAGDPLPLRPLGIGEIFDRAVTLYVRYFVPIALITIVIVLPLTVVQYFQSGSSIAAYQQMGAVIAQANHPGRNPKVPQITNDQIPGWIWLAALVSIILLPFSSVAIGVALARVYEGSYPDWRQCYAAVFRRWGPMLGTLFLSVVIFAAFVIVGFIGYFVLILLTIFSLRAGVGFGIAFGVLTLLFIIVWLVSLAVAQLTIACALFSVVLEGLGFAEAIGRAFSRLFNRREFWRAVVTSLAIGAIYLGLSMLALAVTLAAYFLVHSPLLAAAANGLVTFVHISLLTLLAAVYYFDVRVRREGMDIQEELAQLEPRSP
ncbi:MAG TPA: hypothetical protein VFO29_11035 [Candidatus Rubrimentiphilum sp.]|nr:hypothetical protein [Candidatus Rubrimentiphilum sp.]